MMRLYKEIFLIVVIVFKHESPGTQIVSSDSWTATDALGRKICDYKTAGERKYHGLLCQW